MLRKAILTVFFLVLGAGVAFAAGKHDDLQCTGCHNVHYAKGPIIFEVEPNAKGMPKGAAQGTKSISALCLGCHADPDKGGMGILPISAHTTHPFGSKVNRKVAIVPDGLLREGMMDCVSCHDPHPSNPNYRYLRVDTRGGKDMGKFCAMCHPAKADKSAGRDALKVFDSMDEAAGAKNTPVSELSGAPKAAPAPAPAEKK